MTNVSEEKSVGYFLVSILVIILVYVVIGIILAAIFGAIGFATMKGSFTM